MIDNYPPDVEIQDTQLLEVDIFSDAGLTDRPEEVDQQVVVSLADDYRHPRR